MISQGRLSAVNSACSDRAIALNAWKCREDQNTGHKVLTFAITVELFVLVCLFYDIHSIDFGFYSHTYYKTKFTATACGMCILDIIVVNINCLFTYKLNTLNCCVQHKFIKLFLLTNIACMDVIRREGSYNVILCHKCRLLSVYVTLSSNLIN